MKGQLDRVVVDRSSTEAVVAIASTTVVCTLALPLYLPDIEQISHVLVGGSIVLALVVLGFAAASRCRPLAPRSDKSSRFRLALLALGVGAGLGAANLGANLALAMLDPVVRALLMDRFGTLPLVGSVIGAPIIEETAMRLVFMGVVGWGLAHFVDEPEKVFLGALAVSAVAFGLIHVFRPLPGQSPLDVIYITGVVLKSGLASLPLGWVFWRWGLPYAVLCHSAANAAHRLLAPVVFS